MTRSPPGPHQVSPNQSGNTNSSYNSATWERTLRMNSSSSLVVPPPLGSAPPPSTASALSPSQHHHKPVRASLSSLSSSQMSSGEAANMVISNSNPGKITVLSKIRKKVQFQKLKKIHFCYFKKSIFAQEKSLKLPKMQFTDFFLVQKLIFCHF